MADEMQQAGCRAPCPIVTVTFSLDRPHLKLLQMTDGPAEQEANRLLRYWSQGLGPKESLDVRVDSLFANGYHVETLHHLRSYVPDGTIRSHILHHLELQRRTCTAIEVHGHVWTMSDLASDLQGWPPQSSATRWLTKWALQRQGADMHDPEGMGQAEYASVLLRLLYLDYPVLQALALARTELESWTDQEPAWCRGVDAAHRQASLILLHYQGQGGEST